MSKSTTYGTRFSDFLLRRVGFLLEDLLAKEELGRIDLTYPFALDLLCDESVQQPIVSMSPSLPCCATRRY